jgi:hypothetical protein
MIKTGSQPLGQHAGIVGQHKKLRWVNMGRNLHSTGQDAHSSFKDPLFTSIGTTPDLHVKTGSPCLGTGNPSWITDATEKDLDGKPRVVNGKVDMGAYQQ